MNNLFKIILISILSSLLSGCMIMFALSMSPGTHGSLKCYQYPISKDKLDSAVMFVIKNNSNIDREKLNSNYSIDKTDGKSDTIFNNYYNDGQSYLTIKIKTDLGQNEYIIRFSGGEATTSEIVICYAYDELRNGGSEGNGGVNKKTLNYLTEIFEKELIRKIDIQLNLTHIVIK